MATVTKSIGTSSRDYSTITLWEADLDNTTPYDAADDAVGECYDDSVFAEAVTINGGSTIGLTSITLRPATGERHTGVAGTGARFVWSAVAQNFDLLSSVATTVSDIEWNLNSYAAGTTGAIRVSGLSSGAAQTLRGAIVHNTTRTTGAGNRLVNANANVLNTCNVLDCILYNCKLDTGGTGDASGLLSIVSTVSTRVRNFLNCTVHNITNNVSSNNAYGVSVADNTAITVKNVIATDAGGTTSGAKSCFSLGASAVRSYNLSSDATADGTGSLTSKTSANQFVATTLGSEDLHLKAGADAIGAGTDLGTTPTGVQFDIDNYDRDTGGVTWDIGADQYIAAVTGGDVNYGRWVRFRR